ncbi:MAG: hypothetical protein RLZZ65_249 [Bacteroidota bacterium]|jgi:hypothetical protein
MKIGGVFLLLFFLLSCQKESERRCWKGVGEPLTYQQSFTDFKYLHIHAYMKVDLIQDSLNYVEWQTASNLKSFLQANIDHDTLVLRNNNRCHFLRYKHESVKAIVHFTQLDQINFENSDTVLMKGIWHFDQTELILKEGAGPIQLNLAGQKLFVRNLYGWQNLNLKGELSWLYADMDGSATIEAGNLNLLDSLHFLGASPKTSSIRSGGIKVKAQLHSIGNLILEGQPFELLKMEYNSGKVIVYE